jgi:hypothetical protein
MNRRDIASLRYSAELERNTGAIGLGTEKAE